MILKGEWQKFERELMRREYLPLRVRLHLQEEFYKHARSMGVIPSKDPLDGLDVDIRIARVINGVSKAA